VVIGTYNQRPVLQKTLESLFRQSLSPELYEIQLIDSSSTDGTDKMISTLKPPCRFNYQRVENHGKAAARNLGIKAAEGEIIFLTDADIVAGPKLLEEHLQAHQARKNASFEGMEIDTDGKPYIKARLRSYQKLKWAYFLTGNLSLKKKHLLDAGLFDENFKGYGWEDIELDHRQNDPGTQNLQCLKNLRDEAYKNLGGASGDYAGESSRILVGRQGYGRVRG
jgi:glycosyltransferase involved in cell wall biosynthesis